MFNYFTQLSVLFSSIGILSNKQKGKEGLDNTVMKKHLEIRNSLYGL